MAYNKVAMALSFASFCMVLGLPLVHTIAVTSNTTSSYCPVFVAS